MWYYFHIRLLDIILFMGDLTKLCHCGWLFNDFYMSLHSLQSCNAIFLAIFVNMSKQPLSTSRYNQWEIRPLRNFTLQKSQEELSTLHLMMIIYFYFCDRCIEVFGKCGESWYRLKWIHVCISRWIIHGLIWCRLYHIIFTFIHLFQSL